MILQNPSHPKQVLAALAALIADPAMERLRIAVAYANLDGVTALDALMSAAERTTPVEIVVTLDMGITRKAALQALLDGESAVKAITTGPGMGTFHTKAFVADRNEAQLRAVVGSANLTSAALTTNYEAAWVGDLAAGAASRWERWWGELLGAAVELTPAVIEQYEERRPPPGRSERIADEDVETADDGATVAREVPTADIADRLVIDWGGTGEYRRQLEIPREPAAFFSPLFTEKRAIAIRLDGTEYGGSQLRFYPDNGMVRINLDPNLPVVQDGSIMRFAALFTRLGSDCYELRLVDSDERAERLAESAAAGHCGYTKRRDGTRRWFGWATSP